MSCCWPNLRPKDFQFDTGPIGCLDFSQTLLFYPSNGTDISLEGDRRVQVGLLQPRWANGCRLPRTRLFNGQGEAMTPRMVHHRQRCSVPLLIDWIRQEMLHLLPRPGLGNARRRSRRRRTSEESEDEVHSMPGRSSASPAARAHRRNRM